MSEEAAFLAALKANPADDVARLVYADWLDEHDEPKKAEYLRLVVELAQMHGEYSTELLSVARLLSLAERSPAEWRYAVGSRFTLVLYDDRDTLLTVKSLREVTGAGLNEAHAMRNSPPCRVFDCVPFERAYTAGELFPKGDIVRLLIHPHDLDPLPIRVVYKITAHRFAWNGAPDPAAAQSRSINAFAEFLAVALNIPNESATALAVNHDITIEEAIDSSEIGARWTQLRRLFPPDMPPDDYDNYDNAPTPEWHIYLNYQRSTISLTS